MVATDMTSSGSIEEKLRWAFKMYDKDESGWRILSQQKYNALPWTGVIELQEMIEIIGTIYQLQGFPVVKLW